MPIRRLCFFLLIVVLLAILVWTPSNSQVAGRNVNMVAGRRLPGGDPWLQRQNEPSIAVSTRNALHLLAGANDYRTVEVPIPGEDLPGLPAGVVAGDAWLGVFKSYNGGQSWISTLLPGYPQDLSNEGLESPLFGFQTASDPTVRAGDNGLFFYSGIAFNRGKNGRGVIFVARYLDNNNRENGDPIEYIDTQVIDEGTSGQFADKPWIAVDIPRAVGTVSVNDQSIPSFNVYIVYSLFVGDLEQNVHNKVLFARSTDGGNTWGKPIKLSESQHINQGTTLAIGPDGTIYVAWRRYASGDVPHAILFTKSTDFGQRFTKPAEVDTIDPFDQGTTGTSFRTSSFPTMAVDDNGAVYLAWAERNKGLSPSGGDARIVITASTNRGKKWTLPAEPINDYAGRGHQIMPSLTFGSGKLMMAWYDFRYDYSGNFAYYISDPLQGIRHTVDVRLAQANPVENPGQYPFFYESIQVSRYLWAWHESNFCQVQYNPPNYPLFKQGTVPFHGDYIDIAASPESVFHVVWTDNRDVRPPFDHDWTYYNPPNEDPEFPHGNDFPKEPCTGSEGLRTGMRNQNIYTSRIIPGIEIGSLGNTKPLINTLGGSIQRAYVISVKNTSDYKKHVRLKIINQPPGWEASFFQFEVPPGFYSDQLDVSIAPHSSITRPVFVTSSDFYASVTIEVLEIDDIGSPIESHIGYIDLNSDPANPEIENPPDWEGEDIRDYENHNINIEHTSIVNLTNVNLVNPDINIEHVNLTNPSLNHINIEHINIEHINLTNPNLYIPDPAINIEHVNLTNVNIVHTTIIEEEYPPNVLTNISDVRWTVRNDGNTASSYTFRAVAPEELPTGLFAQLLIYRMHYTPKSDYTPADGCTLKYEPHHELLVNIVDPVINIEHINIEHPSLEIAAIENATFALPPGEEAYIILRIIEPVTDGSPLQTPSAGENFANNVGAGFTAHAANTNQTVPPIATTPPQILTSSLPDGVVGQSYSETLSAFGGKEPYTWSVIEGDLPGGLQLNSTTGEIYSNPLPNTAGTFEFTVDVIDSSSPTQSDTRTLVIRIFEPLVITTTSLPDGVKDSAYNTTLMATGGFGPYEWSLVGAPGWLSINESTGEISGTLTSSGTFSFAAEVNDASQPQQSANKPFSINVIETHTITATAGSGGNIDPSGDVVVIHGDDQEFIITPDQNYHVEDVLVNGTSVGAVSEHIFTNIISNHSIEATFAINTYTITATAGSGGSISPSGEVIVNHGEATTFTITPDSGFHIVDVLVDGNSVGAVSEHIFTNITSNHSIEATFAIDTYTITATAGSGGSISPSGEVIVNHGQTTTFTITPDSGFHIVDVLVNGTSVGAVSVHTFTNITSNHKIEATFGINTYAISGKVTVEGSPLEGVLINGFPESATTDENGQYIAEVEYGWSGTVIPAKEGYSFDPSSRTYTNVTHEILQQDYIVLPRNEEWVERYNNDSVNGDDEAVAIAFDISDKFYVTGYSTGKTTGADYTTIKYDSSRNKEWIIKYDGPSHEGDYATGIAVDASSNSCVTGFSYRGTPWKHSDCYTVKYDSNGNPVWDVRYDSRRNGNDEARAIAVDSEGNVSITCRSEESLGSGDKDYDYYTAKYDTTDGKKLWDDRYDSPGKDDDEAAAIAVDSEGNVYVTGRSYGGSETNYDYYTAKYAASKGNLVKGEKYDGPAHSDDEATAIAVDESGNVYVTGKSMGSGTGFDYCTIKYDADLNQIWAKTYNGPGNSDDEPLAIAVDSSENVYVTGKSAGSGTGLDYATVKYDANGEPRWVARYNGPGNGIDEALAIAVDSSSIYVTGKSKGSDTTFDYYTVKYDSLGNVIWYARYYGPGNGDDEARSIALDSLGNVYVTGSSQGSGTSKDYATVKYRQYFE
jgi:hypothetical protein